LEGYVVGYGLKNTPKLLQTKAASKCILQKDTPNRKRELVLINLVELSMFHAPYYVIVFSVSYNLKGFTANRAHSDSRDFLSYPPNFLQNEKPC
jgi:hypothetical protein